MKRLLGLAIAAVLVTAAVAAPRPPEAPVPDFAAPIQPDSGAAARASVWYCPLMDAGAARNTILGFVALSDTDVGITLPSPVPNEAPDVLDVTVAAPIADGLDLGEIARRGQAPGFVEFTDGPAAVSAIVLSDVSLTGDGCLSFASKTWHLTGGTTRDGWELTLRLFNPFPDNAKVTVNGTSEFGVVPLPELDSFDVSARAWRDVDLGPIVPFLDDLSLTVTSEEGLVIPTLVMAAGADQASWPGTGLSTVWEFPLTSLLGMSSSLMLSNPGATPVTAEIDLYTPEGQLEPIEPVTIDPSTPARVALQGFDDTLAVRVRADGPIAAAVVAQSTPSSEGGGEGGGDEFAPGIVGELAATPGAVATATQWLLPSAGTLVDGELTVWLLNSGIEPATVTVVPLGSEEVPVEKVVVDPGTVLPISLEVIPEVFGYFIDSLSPISTAWSTRTAGGVVFVGGTAVGG